MKSRKFYKGAIDTDINHYRSILNVTYSESITPDNRKIATILLENLNKTKKLPPWWSTQESSYLANIDDLFIAFNYVIFRYKFVNYPKEYYNTHFPLYVCIEPVSACNLRCPFCFQNDKTFSKKPYMGLMKFDLFTRIVDECCENGTGAITLASRGEPSLHPELPKMLDYLKGKFFELKLNTNATKLTEELCHAIFESKVNDLVISVDSEKKEEFEKLRVNANFESFLENIQLLTDIKNKYYPSTKTVIRIAGVKFLKEQDIGSFTSFYSNYADEITVYPAEKRWNTYENDKVMVGEPCRLLWERLYIWFDGTTNLCDVDYKSLLSPGKVDKNTNIKRIWNNKNIAELRELHSQGKRDVLVPCDRCGIYK